MSKVNIVQLTQVIDSIFIPHGVNKYWMSQKDLLLEIKNIKWYVYVF